ncbi:hypothetical protein C7271_11585, partial [filamentous cyanobacterium CCP5]
LGGDDDLYGDGGDDHLYGGPGEDFLDGGTGSNYLAGGEDDDTYIIRSTSDRILEFSSVGSANWGNNDLIRTYLYTTEMRDYDNVENLLMASGGAFNAYGNNLANFITGNGNDNVILGRAGADSLEGAEGDDQLDGGRGADYISGGPGNDYIVGGNGADIIVGSTGKDTLLGDNGPAGTSYAGDEFRYFSTQDSLPGIDERDLIFDFDPGMDFIDLSRIDADVFAAGNQSFEFIGTNNFSFSKDAPAEVRYYSTGSSVVVQVNVRGAFAFPGPNMAIEIEGISALSASDFIGVN